MLWKELNSKSDMVPGLDERNSSVTHGEKQRVVEQTDEKSRQLLRTLILDSFPVASDYGISETEIIMQCKA